MVVCWVFVWPSFISPAKQTEAFLRGWYTDSANADFIVTAQGAERTVTGGTGKGDITNQSFLDTMFKDAMVEENSTVPSFGQMARYRQIRDTRGQEAADAYAESEGFDPSRHNRFAMGGKYKVLKGGGRAPMGALSALFRR